MMMESGGVSPRRRLPDPPVAIAHRGGAHMAANIGRENTLASFGAALELGINYLELDVRASRDGDCFVFHDDSLSRLTGLPGTLEELASAEVDDLRLAGGARIPRLADVLDAFPEAMLNVDLKCSEVIDPAVATIDGAGAWDRVILAAFSHERLTRVRADHPLARTSTSPKEVAALRFGGRRGRDFVARGGAVCTQVPPRHRGVPVLTAGFIRSAHLLGMQAHVWTIDEPDQMHRWLDAGVDGIMSDRPDTLVEVLRARGQWSGNAPGPAPVRD